MAKTEINSKGAFYMRESHLRRIEKLRLMDDDFFSEALDGKREAVQYILRVILNRDDLEVVATKAQVEYRSATKRSIRIDIKAVDHIERRIEEDNYSLFEDGLHILYVNGEYQDAATPVGRLMHDFHCTKSEDMYSRELADEVKYLKETEGGQAHMCKILEEMCDEVAERVEKETAERVEKENKIKMAKRLLKLNKLSYEEISETAGLSLSKVKELAAEKRHNTQ